jgi:hypothetical protein
MQELGDGFFCLYVCIFGKEMLVFDLGQKLFQSAFFGLDVSKFGYAAAPSDLT